MPSGTIADRQEVAPPTKRSVRRGVLVEAGLRVSVLTNAPKLHVS